MKNLPIEEQIQALAEMQEELEGVKSDVDSFNDDIADISPGDISFDEEDMGDLNPGEKEKASQIKTPEDAKKALNEAKKDIQDVLDNLDALVGKTEEEQKTANIKRPSQKYASSIVALASSAEKAIDEAKNALTHWSYLLKLKKNPSKRVATSAMGKISVEEAADTLISSKRAIQKVEKIFKEGTSVPPTGSEFSGDKWPNGKDPKEIEDRAWHAGAGKFDKDLAWEHKRTNPAVDKRLTTEEYPRDDAPYVNATLHVVDGENRYASYWDIFDTKQNKRMLVTFANLPTEIAPAADDNHLKMFTSQGYGNCIIAHIQQHGFDNVQSTLNGKIAKFDLPKLAKTAADSKTNIRKFYKDAYGDPSYASKLTAGEDKSKMDVAYTPEESTIKDYDDKTKDGTGTLSKQKPVVTQKVATEEDKAVIQAKANKAVEGATFAASRGVIPYTVQDVRKLAKEYFNYTDAEYKAVMATLGKLPLTNEAALKEAHIPDAEAGVVGNPLEGVRDPKASVKTEDIDTNVSSDAKIAKQASFVPQISKDNALQVKSPFKSRIVEGLQKKGVLQDVKGPRFKSV
ncbi:MAG: hypothetical protein WC346_06370 [Methanogenium sp.]|jgi:hypothetical protein